MDFGARDDFYSIFVSDRGVGRNHISKGVEVVAHRKVGTSANC